jgi:hypothetical protein
MLLSAKHVFKKYSLFIKNINSYHSSFRCFIILSIYTRLFGLLISRDSVMLFFWLPDLHLLIISECCFINATGSSAKIIYFCSRSVMILFTQSLSLALKVLRVRGARTKKFGGPGGGGGWGDEHEGKERGGKKEERKLGQ